MARTAKTRETAPESRVNEDARALTLDHSQIVVSDGVPDILIDGISTVAVVNGIARINCFAVRPSATGSAQAPVLVLRINLSIPGVVNAHSVFTQIVEGLKKDGVIKDQA